MRISDWSSDVCSSDLARSTMDPRNKSAGDEWSGWDRRAATPVTSPSHSPRRLRAVALQHGVDEREAFGEAVERHEGADARAFLLAQQDLVKRLEPAAQVFVAVLLADRVDLVLDRQLGSAPCRESVCPYG